LIARYCLALLSLVLFSAGLSALPLDKGPVLIRITPQVMEPDHTVSWKDDLDSKTLPGHAVVVSIEANHVTILVSVTPYVLPDGYLLVVQGDVRQSGPEGLRRSSSVQSLQVKPRQAIVFFPLGRADPASREMEVLISVENGGD